MLTKQNPQTYTKYKMYICTIYKWIHTYIHHTHTGTLTDIHSQTTQLHTIKHMHSLAQNIYIKLHTHHRELAQTHIHLQVYHIKHRHIHTQMSFIHQYLKAYTSIHTYRYTPIKHPSKRGHTQTYKLISSQVTQQCSHICSYHKHTHTPSVQAHLSPVLGAT